MGRIRDVWNTAIGRGPVLERALSLNQQFVSGTSLNSPLGTGLDSTFRVVPFFAAIRLITDTFAATPLHAYQDRPDGGSERIEDPPFLSVPYGTMASWKTQCITSLLTRGNAFGYATTYDRNGVPDRIVWLDPGQMWCDQHIIRPQFQYQGEDVPLDQISHIPWIVPAGKVTGLSPVEYFRATFTMSASAQSLANEMFTAGGVPIGHLQFLGDNNNGVLTNEQAEIASSRFHSSIQGRKNFVSGADWKYEAIGLKADDARFIEAIKLSATQVASIFGIPPEEIGGEVAKSLTYSTVEMNGLKLATQTMRPYFVRVEEALSALLPPGQYLKFNADAGVRTDLKTRMEATDIALHNGSMTISEARALEDKAPLTPKQLAEYLTYSGKAPGGLQGAQGVKHLEPGPAVQAEGTRAGGENLKDYWLHGEGLAKWAPKPHPWTALYHHLLEYLPPDRAKRTASQWFHDHFGYWPGDRGGDNPVGHG